MNKLTTHKRVKVLSAPFQGKAMGSVRQLEDVSINTVSKLFVEAGEPCSAHHDERLVNVPARHVQCDEIWLFCCAKNKNVPKAKAEPAGAGDVWTWAVLERNTKLIVAYEVGYRSGATANQFVAELRSRLANHVQLTTDGHKVYPEAVNNAFGIAAGFARLIKIYGGETGQDSPHRYSPAECTGIKRRPVTGKPIETDVSTIHVERQDLSMCIGMLRFTRLTNAFNKKLANHVHTLSLYFVHYNFVRIHKLLRMTPALAAGLSKEVREMDWIVELIDARAGKPNRTKRTANKIQTETLPMIDKTYGIGLAFGALVATW